MQVDDPVHQVEADEAHGKHYPRVLVNVRWSDAEQFVNVLKRAGGRSGKGTQLAGARHTTHLARVDNMWRGRPASSAAA